MVCLHLLAQREDGWKAYEIRSLIGESAKPMTCGALLIERTNEDQITKLHEKRKFLQERVKISAAEENYNRSHGVRTFARRRP